MIRFVTLKQEHLEMVMQWRAKPDVSQYMITDVELDIDVQKRWFEKVSKDESYRYWIIIYQDIPIGLINLAAIDWVNLHCSAGYYIGEKEYRSIGAMIPPYIYNYIFKELKFRKICGEVINGNTKVLQMLQMHGFRIVGTYHEHIYKNGHYFDVIIIELLSELWLKQKRYKRYIADFSLAE